MSTVVSVSPFCEMIANAPAGGSGAIGPDPLNNGVEGTTGTASNDAIESTLPTPSTVRSSAPSAVRSTSSRPGRLDQSATTRWPLSALKSNGTAAALVSAPGRREAHPDVAAGDDGSGGQVDEDECARAREVRRDLQREVAPVGGEAAVRAAGVEVRQDAAGAA